LNFFWPVSGVGKPACGDGWMAENMVFTTSSEDPTIGGIFLPNWQSRCRNGTGPRGCRLYAIVFEFGGAVEAVNIDAVTRQL